MDKRGRILYAASTADHIDRFHLGYIEGLREMGYEVEVMARGSAEIDMPFEKRIFSLKNVFVRRAIKNIINHGEYDAVILNTALAAFLVRAALPSNRRPRTVNIVHGYLFPQKGRHLRSLIFFLCEWLMRGKTDSVITMNGRDFRLASSFGLSCGEVYLSRGMGVGLRDEITPTETVRREFFGDGSFSLVFVGELSERKNQGFLIRAVKKIKLKIPNVRLVLVGDGDARAELLSLAASLGISDSVIFAGERRDACDFIRASDLYVSASRIEGLPFNIAEALGIGKTVLASRIKGHEDIIEDGVSGFLFSPNDIDDFVNKACQIYRKDMSLSESAIKKRFEKFEYSSVYPEMLGLIYKSINPTEK